MKKVKIKNNFDKKKLDAYLLFEDCGVAIILSLPSKKDEVPCLLMCKYNYKEKYYKELTRDSFINLYTKKDKLKVLNLL